MDTSDRLIRILNRERKELQEEISFLRDMLWQVTNGAAFDTPDPVETRQEEPVEKSVWDLTCEWILEGVLDEI